MQKRSHKLLASALAQKQCGFGAKRYQLAFLFGSFQPDCNPFSYLKGSFRAHTFRGHNFSNSRPYMETRILRLQRRKHWTVWQYYTLGKLTHYLADAFTYPHNETFSASLTAHHNYESELRRHLEKHLPHFRHSPVLSSVSLIDSIRECHRQYLQSPAGLATDTHYIFHTAQLLMTLCPSAE